VPNCKSFIVTDAERKHVRRRARFQHRDASCHQVPPPPQGKTPKEIHAILTETLEEHALSYATVKNSLNVVIFPPVMRFFLDRRISAKSIAELLGISRERY
jgi:hypothetical protein